jgi:DNA polymerase-3 subunit delta'
MRHCYRLHPSQILPWIDEFVQLGRVNQKHFFRYGLHFLQQLIRLQLMGTDYPVRLRPAERETAKRMSEVIPFDRVEAIAELFNDSIYHIERNVNPKVMMMDNTFRLFRIIHQGEGVVAQKR